MTRDLAAARRAHERDGGYLLDLGEGRYLVCGRATALDLRCGSGVADTREEAERYLTSLAPGFDETAEEQELWIVREVALRASALDNKGGS